MQQSSKWNQSIAQDYWQRLAERSGIEATPELLKYIQWRETPAEIRQPKTQTEFSRETKVSEDTLEASFLFLFERATHEWLYGA